MRRVCHFGDGPLVRIPLRFADVLEVSLLLSHPLKVLGLTNRNR